MRMTISIYKARLCVHVCVCVSPLNSSPKGLEFDIPYLMVPYNELVRAVMYTILVAS